MPALSQKDRRALLICLVVLVLFILVRFVLFPLLDERKRLERGIEIKEKGLVEMQAMQAEVSQFSHQNNTLGQRVAERPESFGLFAFLEQKGAEAKVKENILYMKPSDTAGEGELQQVAVEIKLQAVYLAELTSFLGLIESPENIVELERITILVNKKEPGTLDATMRVISLVQDKKNGG